MPSMTKRVNITTTIPVRTVTPPLSGTYKDIIMTTGDILKCISRRAIVDEILPNDTTIRLTMRNYYLDNGAGLDAAERAAASKIVDEEHVDPPKGEEATAPAEEEEQAPELPVVEPEVTADEEETKVAENPVVETEPYSTEPEASVEPAVETWAAQAVEEPPVQTAEPEVTNEEVVSHEEETRDKQPDKKTTTKKGSSKKTTTKKTESTVEAAAEEGATE